MNKTLNRLRQIEEGLKGLLPDVFIRRSIITIVGLELCSAVMVLVLWALKLGPPSSPFGNAVEATLSIGLALIGIVLLILYLSLIVILPVFGIVNFVRKAMKDDKGLGPRLRSVLVGSVLLGLNWPLFWWLFILIDRYSIPGAD